MDTYTFIYQQLTANFPLSTNVLVQAVTDSIYQNLLQNQGKQEVDAFERIAPDIVKAAISARIGQGWQVLQMVFPGESTINNPSDPGTLQAYPGMSGIVIYTKP